MLSTSVVSSRLSCSIYVAQAELYSILLKAPGFSESEYWLNVSCIQSVQLLSRVRLFMIPWTAALQASLSTTKSQSLLKLMSIESVIISSSVVPFSSHLQSFPASGSFQMSQFFASGGQSIGVSASASVLPMNIQD